MKRNVFTYIMCLAVLATFAGSSALAGQGRISIDRVVGRLTADTVQAGETLRFILKYDNTGTVGVGSKCDVSNGWRISSPDGAVWDSVLLDSLGPVNIDNENLFLVKFNQTGGIGNFIRGDGAPTADSIGFIGAGNPGSASRQLPITWNDTCLQIYVYFHDASSHSKHICIDSAFFGTGGSWKWVVSNVNPPVDYFPEWVGLAGQTYDHANGGYCFLLWDQAQGVDGVDDLSLPKQFALSQNYPNPFNPGTSIDFDLPVRSTVNLAIYNVLGQRVRTLIANENLPAKHYTKTWDGTTDRGTAAASGIYFYKIEAGTFVQTRKMVLMK
jgi:hypothetical protein